MQKLDSVGFSSGLLILFSLGATYILSSLGFFLDIPLSVFTFPCGVLSAFLVLVMFVRFRTLLISAAVYTGIFFLTAFLTAHLYDFSYDGQCYHQEMVVLLAEGWNPFLQPAGPAGTSIWSLHYAKCLETLAATVCILFRDVEIGKSVNLLLVISTALLAWYISGRMYPRIRTWRKWLYTILLILNPVGCAQVLSYYTDFSLYYYILLSIGFGFLIYKDICRHVSGIGLFMVIILGAGTKFNIFFFTGLTVFGMLVWFLLKKDYRAFRRVMLISLTAAILGSLVISYHPYVTNFRTAGNPLYPLLGEGAEDIMTGNTPEEFLGNNRFTNFILSYSTPTGAPYTDSRINGFGMSFGLLLLIGVISSACRICRNRKVTAEDYVVILSIASAFIFAQSWWARYNPQLWLVVPITFLKMVRSGRKWIPIAYFATAMLCIIPVSGLAVTASYKKSAYIKAARQVLAGRTVEGSCIFPQTIYQYTPYGITFTSVPLDSIPSTERFSLDGYFQGGHDSLTILRVDQADQKEVWDRMGFARYIFRSTKPDFIP